MTSCDAGGILFFSAGVMVVQVVSCIQRVREVTENIAGLEELLRQEELLDGLSDKA